MEEQKVEAYKAQLEAEKGYRKAQKKLIKKLKAIKGEGIRQDPETWEFVETDCQSSTSESVFDETPRDDGNYDVIAEKFERSEDQPERIVKLHGVNDIMGAIRQHKLEVTDIQLCKLFRTKRKMRT